MEDSMRGLGGFLLTAVAVACVSGCGGRVSERSDNSQNEARQTTTNTAVNQATTSETVAPAPTAPKPKAAVYIMGNPAGRDALRMAVNTFLVKSGRYQMIAVDAIDIVAQEHQRQMSGSVSDEQIAKLGFDAGAEYVCVVERTELDGVSYVATRMVSVESKVAEFADMVKLPQGGDIIEFIKWQIGSMLGIDVGPKQTSLDGSGVLTDGRDGKKYRTVVIGDKRWMGENLNYQPQHGNSWCYNNDNSKCGEYGRLYDFNTAKTACMTGWHLPSPAEWGNLVVVAGGYKKATKKLKAKSGWNKKGNGSDDFGFSALPGGIRSDDGYFYNAGNNGIWWTTSRSKIQIMTHDNKGAYLYGNYEDDDEHSNGFSVRCVEG
jgi:uncharacterized protein (TIGR02145 family)